MSEDNNASESEAAQDKATPSQPAFYYRLETLRFSGGQTISVGTDDVVVIVGGNNVGKSQALKDVLTQLSAPDAHDASCRVVIQATVSIDLDPDSVRAFAANLESTDVSQLSRMGKTLNRDAVASWLKGQTGSALHETLRRHFLAFTTHLVSTEDRLRVTMPVQAIDLLKHTKSHPYHYLADDIELEEEISTVFRKAFGTDVIVNRTAGSVIRLHVGDRPYATGAYNIDKKARTSLSSLPPLEEQGDGMRAFVGCLMWGTVVNYQIVFIDEPEAFLHPPQARLMGRTLVKRKKPASQLVVATHSGDLLRGVLDADAKNVRILRLNRDGLINPVMQLQPDAIVELWGDPLLRQTNLLDALFHRQTVICESDGDCQFFSAITNVLVESQNRVAPDVLFIPAGGMHRFPAIIKPLRVLGVPIKVVADFDILRDESPLKPVVEALGGSWNDISSTWREIRDSVSAKKAQLDKDDLQKTLNETLAKVQGDVVPDNVLKEIREAARKASAWAYAKTAGEAFLPSGQPFNRWEQGLFRAHR